MVALFGGSWGPNGLRISQVCSLVCLGQVPGWLSLADRGAQADRTEWCL